MKSANRHVQPAAIFAQLLIFFWLVVFVIGLIERNIFHLSSDYWYPFFIRSVRFTDLTIYTSRFQYFHQSRFFDMPGFPFTYPAPIAIAYSCIFALGKYAVTGFIILCFAAFFSAAALLAIHMRSRGAGALRSALYVTLCLLLSYPFWFMVDRANFEIVNWLMVSAGVAAYWKKKWYLAAAFLGIAVSMKLFPFMLFGLLVGARKYKAVVFGITAAIISTVLSTWFIGPTYTAAASGIAHGLNFFKLQYALQVHRMEIGFDHSLFAAVKEAFFPLTVPRGHFSPYLLDSYLVILGITGLALFFLKIRHLPRTNQVMALTVVSILFPPVSGDYTLTYLYIPWAILILASLSIGKSVPPRGLVSSLACLAFLMAPESYCVVDGVRIAGQLKAIALVLLLAISLIYPLKDPRYIERRPLSREQARAEAD